MPVTVSTPDTPQSTPVDSRESTIQSCRAPAAWPAVTSRGQVLAERANSVVWLGQRDPGVSLQVVVLDSQATALERARFVDGALRLRALGHLDGLTHVVDVDEGGRWYACDDRCASELGRVDVSEWSLAERLEFVIAVLEVLHAVHTRGLVHGALCPDNVLVAADRGPILTEVGIVDVALLAGRDGTRLDDYRSFAAPEVCRGESFDRAADLYSVGRLLEYVLVERLVEPGERRTIAFGAHGEFAETLAGVVARATHEERGARYPSAHEMMRELSRVARDVRRNPCGGGRAASLGLGARGLASASMTDDWKRSPLGVPQRLWLGSPPVPAGSFRRGLGPRRVESELGRSARPRPPRALAALELVALVLLVLTVVALWFVR